VCPPAAEKINRASSSHEAASPHSTVQGRDSSGQSIKELSPLTRALADGGQQTHRHASNNAAFRVAESTAAQQLERQRTTEAAATPSMTVACTSYLSSNATVATAGANADYGMQHPQPQVILHPMPQHAFQSHIFPNMPETDYCWPPDANSHRRPASYPGHSGEAFPAAERSYASMHNANYSSHHQHHQQTMDTDVLAMNQQQIIQDLVDKYEVNTKR
jgi:hypothetical protein